MYYGKKNTFIIILFVHNMLMARPLNILFVVGHFPAPSQTFIVSQITGLIDKGHNVSIFSFHKDNINTIPSDIKKYQLLERVVYEDFSKITDDCDIVFCQFGYHGKKIVEMAKSIPWLKNKKVVTCLRGTDITVRIMNDVKSYYDLFKKGHLFLPVCDYFKKLLIQYGCPEEKIVIHHSAIDCSKFFFTQRIFPEKKPIELISVSRLVEKKGIKYAIKAVAHVLKRYRNLKYHIVGDGPERSRLHRLIKKLKMQNKIILHGWKSQGQVVDMLNKSHIFILPSVTAANGNKEGIPNALKEAMAMGLPVISTLHAGTPELIENSVSGFLVSEKNFLAIYNKIMYLITHSEVWAPISIAARKKIEEEFEIIKTIEALERLFYQLLNEIN